MSGAKRSLEKEAFWRLVLEEFHASRLSVRAFCKQESISEASFYSWRKELQKRDQEKDKEASPQTRGLVPVRIVGSSVPTPSTKTPARRLLEVLTPCGYTLRVDHDVDPQRLGQWLAAVAVVPSGLADASATPTRQDGASC